MKLFALDSSNKKIGTAQEDQGIFKCQTATGLTCEAMTSTYARDWLYANTSAVKVMSAKELKKQKEIVKTTRSELKYLDEVIAIQRVLIHSYKDVVDSEKYNKKKQRLENAVKRLQGYLKELSRLRFNAPFAIHVAENKIEILKNRRAIVANKVNIERLARLIKAADKLEKEIVVTPDSES